MAVSDKPFIDADSLRVGVSLKSQAGIGRAMRVLDVDDLGWDAVRVCIEGERVLLIEAGMTAEERINLLSRVMADMN